ncbi:hypothetical protein GCM10009715_26670 [Paeniglutamicibacter psychrophenolicus]|uniref:Uncharacterized protein n=1 Tax=Paeniglutamicibacter psychrophenolicus TaxID=257454 RepID=A0ABS4WGA8_9MICC|nr:hypothetical protein [Paeniglutamicibacter psychrophenolicus]
MDNVLDLASGNILTREDNRAAVPREPNDRLLDALVHVAFASWSNSWENKGRNDLVRWIVVAHDIRTGARIHHGATKNPRPMEEILTDIHRVVSDAGAPAWVAVPSKRGGVAAVLHETGTPVTRGLDPRNRAVGILIPEMARQSQQQSQDAIRAGLLCPEQRAALRKAEPVAQRPTTEKLYWWPEYLDISGMHTNKMVFRRRCIPGSARGQRTGRSQQSRGRGHPDLAQRHEDRPDGIRGSHPGPGNVVRCFNPPCDGAQ